MASRRLRFRASIAYQCTVRKLAFAPAPKPKTSKRSPASPPLLKISPAQLNSTQLIISTHLLTTTHYSPLTTHPCPSLSPAQPAQPSPAQLNSCRPAVSSRLEFTKDICPISSPSNSQSNLHLQPVWSSADSAVQPYGSHSLLAWFCWDETSCADLLAELPGSQSNYAVGILSFPPSLPSNWRFVIVLVHFIVVD